VRINHKYDYWNLLDWCDKQKISLLSGFAELRYYNSENKTVTARIDSNQTDTYYESYNSCMLIQSGDTDLPQVYTKMRLTPMAERLPYSEFLMFMRSWFEWGVGISAWGIGTEQKNLNLYLNSDTAKIGPVICIESIYPEFVSIAALSGAEFLVIITNDAWYDYTPGPEQHYLIAAMRAIENRRYIARCANTGVTGVISPTGKTISRLKEYNKLGLYEIVPRITELTFYSKHGDWLALTTFFISLLSVIFSYLKKKI
jgi:apolipoprotein N-acyltransferase